MSTKIQDMAMCEEIAYHIGDVSCSEEGCESRNVSLLGTYEYDDEGMYIDLKCHHCGATTQDGDGQFFVYLASKEEMGIKE